EGGALVSSTPVVLGRMPLVDRRRDLVGMAEWLQFGHTIGNRYMLRGIKLLAMGEALHWDGRASHAAVVDSSVRDAGRSELDADGGAIAELVEQACARLAGIDSAPAHLQSAGWDSRFLLACWPAGHDPVCYTYGDPAAIEPAIAAQVAAVRGSRYEHRFASASDVAGSLDSMFEASGVMVFPDRYLIARQIKADGHRSVLDGFLGDVLIGGGYDRTGRFLGEAARLRR